MTYPADHSVAPMKVRAQHRSVSRPKDKLPTRQRKPKVPRYVLTMSPGKDSTGSADRAEALAAWIEQVFTLFKNELRWSKSKVIKESGVSRSAVYRWKDTGENGQLPEPEILDKFCANLYRALPNPLLDPTVPYGILGWGRPASMASTRAKSLADEESFTVLDGKLRRVRAILRMSTLTDEQRAKYEAIKESGESAMEVLMDRIIADFEREATRRDE